MTTAHAIRCKRHGTPLGIKLDGGVCACALSECRMDMSLLHLQPKETTMSRSGDLLTAGDQAASPRLICDGEPPNPSPWPDPTPEMLASPQFEAVWQCIRRWDINVPQAYAGYCGATGNHVRAILDALQATR